jgi:type IV fimbrial biogenesis protein FimT
VQFVLANGNAASWTVGCVTVVLDLDGDGHDDCPAIIQSKSAREGGSGTITIAADGTRTLVFNSLGTLNAIAGQMTQVTVDNTAVSAALSTDLNLLINAGGTARVCDTNVSVTTDSRYC